MHTNNKVKQFDRTNSLGMFRRVVCVCVGVYMCACTRGYVRTNTHGTEPIPSRSAQGARRVCFSYLLMTARKITDIPGGTVFVMYITLSPSDGFINRVRYGPATSLTILTSL